MRSRPVQSNFAEDEATPEDVLQSKPAQTVKLLKENDADFPVLSDDEEKRYLLAAPQPLQDVAILMLETGMRCGEV